MDQAQRLTLQIAGKCCYSGCGENAIDGSDYCAPHDAHERGRDAAKKRRHRQQLAEAGLCIVAGCGAKVPKKRKKGGSVLQRRCRSCRKARGAKARAKRGVPGAAAGVPGAPTKGERIRAATVVDKDGRTRYLGQGKRGAPSNATLDMMDLQHALKEVNAAIDGCARYQTPEVQALGRIQRDDIRQAYVGRAFNAARAILELCERAGWAVTGMGGEDDEIAASPAKRQP